MTDDLTLADLDKIVDELQRVAVKPFKCSVCGSQYYVFTTPGDDGFFIPLDGTGKNYICEKCVADD